MTTTARGLLRPYTALVTITAALLASLLTFTPAHGRVVDDYGTYQGQVSCDPHAKPGVVATRNLLRNKFGGRDLGIVRGCRVGGVSEHKEGRAWDWGLNTHNTRDRRIATRAIQWLTKTIQGEPAANARRLGIMYMIWNKKMWRAYDPDAGWQPYTGSSPHTDHIHMSFTWNGSTKRTSYWTGNVEPFDYGPCPKWVNELAAPWRAPRLTPCLAPLNRPKANRNGIYLAQEGETVTRVARWFHLTDTQVRRWNGYPTTGPVTLNPGDRIRVTRPTT